MLPESTGNMNQNNASLDAGNQAASLQTCIKRSLEVYFKDLRGQEPGNLYELVLGEMEKPLLEMVMQRTGSNITRAAQLLGLNRATLRKKLKKYGLHR